MRSQRSRQAKAPAPLRSAIVSPLLILMTAGFACAQEPCTVERPTATLQIPHVAGDPPLSTDPSAPVWRGVGKMGVTAISKDCSKQIDYPALRSQVRSFWTDQHLYLLFSCPYKELNLFLPALGGGPRDKLWERDVVEMFLGDDWTHIRHYREFEIAPTGAPDGPPPRASIGRRTFGMPPPVSRCARSAALP